MDPHARHLVGWSVGRSVIIFVGGGNLHSHAPTGVLVFTLHAAGCREPVRESHRQQAESYYTIF